MPQHTGGHTLVAVDEDSAVPLTYRVGARIVRTPLDLIRALDEQPDRVVLVGAFARDRSFAAFIRETLPSCDVVVLDRTEHSPAFQLAYA